VYFKLNKNAFRLVTLSAEGAKFNSPAHRAGKDSHNNRQALKGRNNFITPFQGLSPEMMLTQRDALGCRIAPLQGFQKRFS
jgi:hypothetical protein